MLHIQKEKLLDDCFVKLSSNVEQETQQKCTRM